MGLRDMLRAIREYPAAHIELETARAELRQAQRALAQSEQAREGLSHQVREQKHHVTFLSHQSAALHAALQEFCPRLSSAEDMKRLYHTISPSMDAQGFTLYRMARELTGIDVFSFFPYEDSRGLFEEADGRQLMVYLTAAHFHAVDWTIVPGTIYESAALREVDTATPEYRAFERELYGKVLERMGFQDILIQHSEKEVTATADRTTELKLYCPLSGGLMKPGYDELQELDDHALTAFQDVIFQRVADEQTGLKSERGLMADYDWLDAVNEKVLSLFPSAEEIDGKMYGVAVCQVTGTLTPGELEELKEFCAEQFSCGWGEPLREHPSKTDSGELCISFWQDSGDSILTKEEMESARAAGHSPRQLKRGGDAR